MENNLFLLKDEYLYKLENKENQKYLRKLAKFETNISDNILMYDLVIYDSKNYILLLAKTDHFEIFEISSESKSIEKPIQKITSSGGFQGAEMIKLKNNEVTLVTATLLSNMETMIR